MPPRRRIEPEREPPPLRRPATTPQAREHELIELSVDLAERQLREGTASAQVISHYLKLGSSRERLEQQRLELENELIGEKIETLKAQARIEELYANAISVMRAYSGQEPEGAEDDYDPDY